MRSSYLFKILKSRPDIFYVRDINGVWLRNRGGSIFVGGKDACQLISALFDRTDGTSTTSDICSALSIPDCDAFYKKIVRPLLNANFLYHSSELDVQLPTQLLELHGSQIAFLEQYTSQPVKAFLAATQNRISLIVDNCTVTAVATAALEFGFCNCEVISLSDDLSNLNRMISDFATLGSTLQWHLLPNVTNFDPIKFVQRHVPKNSTVILIALCTVSTIELSTIISNVQDTVPNATIAVLAQSSDYVYSAPALPHKAEASYCHDCLALILPQGLKSTSSQAISIAAFLTIEQVFSYLSGTLPKVDNAIFTVDCRNLEIRRHHPRRHLLCTNVTHDAGEMITPYIEDTHQIQLMSLKSYIKDSVDRETYNSRLISIAGPITDSVMGPIASIGEDDLPQLPLGASRCQLIIRNHQGAPLTTCNNPIECFAISTREARNQCVLFSLELIAREFVKARDIAIDSIGIGLSYPEALYRAFSHLTLEDENDLSAISLPADTLVSISSKSRDLHSYLDSSLYDRNISLTILGFQAACSGFFRVGVSTLGVQHYGVGRTPTDALLHAKMNTLASSLRTSAAGIQMTAFVMPVPDVNHEHWSSWIRSILKYYNLYFLSGLTPMISTEIVCIGATKSARSTT